MELATTPMMERQREHRENSTQATQTANIAARLERLPMTSYQRGMFAIIATAWFVDSMDLGALTFLLGPIRQTFWRSTAEAGMLSSMSFLGMFVGAASAGLLADRFGRATRVPDQHDLLGLGSIPCGVSPTVQMLAAARVLLGFGMGMEFPVAQSMVSEMIPAGGAADTSRCSKVSGRSASLPRACCPTCGAVGRRVALGVHPPGIPAMFVLMSAVTCRNCRDGSLATAMLPRAERVMSAIEARSPERLDGATLPAPQPEQIELRAPPGLPTLFSAGYGRRTMMLWCLWFFALLGFYGLTTWLGALLQAKGFPVTKSVYLHDPDFAGGHSRFSDRGLDDRGARAQARP